MCRVEIIMFIAWHITWFQEYETNEWTLGIYRIQTIRPKMFNNNLTKVVALFTVVANVNYFQWISRSKMWSKYGKNIRARLRTMSSRCPSFRVEMRMMGENCKFRVAVAVQTAKQNGRIPTKLRLASYVGVLLVDWILLKACAAGWLSLFQVQTYYLCSLSPSSSPSLSHRVLNIMARAWTFANNVRSCSISDEICTTRSCGRRTWMWTKHVVAPATECTKAFMTLCGPLLKYAPQRCKQSAVRL